MFSLKRNQQQFSFFTILILSLLQVPLSAQVKNTQSKEIEVHQAKPIEVYTATPLDQQQNKVTPSVTTKTNTPGEIEIYKPGVDVIENGNSPDPRLEGRWKLSIPGTAWETETDKGSYTERTLNIGKGAGIGTLTINSARQYVWITNSGARRGKLVQVRPRSDLQKGVNSYWRISDGKNNYYIFWDAKINSLNVYNEKTHLFAMSAVRM